VAEVLSVIYEVDFLGFSYGFRPVRSPHGALAALHTALMSQRVNWVLDADIRRFFDSVDHEWLLRMVAHRVAELKIRAGDVERFKVCLTDTGYAWNGAVRAGFRYGPKKLLYLPWLRLWT
jgi:retron-type reverse transcriptase